MTSLAVVLKSSSSSETLAALSIGCAGSKPPVVTPDTQKAANAAPAPSSSLPSPTSSNVSISDEIRTKCGISDADAYFPFDSAHVTSTDHSPLDLVAKCFTSGPLAGRSVKLVGRADPRGPSDYNLTLGQSRADAVSSYLHGARHGEGQGRAHVARLHGRQRHGRQRLAAQSPRRRSPRKLASLHPPLVGLARCRPR